MQIEDEKLRIDPANLQALNNILITMRSEAIRMRQETGIEQIWEEDEAAYEANAVELDEWRNKPPGRTIPGNEKNTSRIGYNITAPYCDTASASMGDMLFPVDDHPWSMSPTIVPEVIELAKGNIPTDIRDEVESQMGEKAQDIFTKAIEQAAKDYEAAKKRVEQAERRIQDWHSECQFVSHCREVLDDCAKVGTGVIKGPFPVERKKAVFANGELLVKSKIEPASMRISYWNAFPDLNAGQNIHQGSYFFERDDITAKELEDLKGSDYLDSEIDAVLREGPYKATGRKIESFFTLTDMGMVEKKGTFEIWYMYGRLSAIQLEDAGFSIKGEGYLRNVYMVMVNGRIIKATRNPMEMGDFPYDILPWKKRKGVPFGIGIAREIRTAQRMVDAAIRNLMNNAGIAGGPMLGFIKGAVRPVSGKAEIKPLKMWEIDPTVVPGITRVDQAISYIKIDMVQAELQSIIDRGLKMAEDITGMPMLLQGQQGSAPDTVGGMTILSNNASMMRRRIARLFDSKLTTPHIRRYYDFLLQYGKDEEKGDMMIVAKGSSALVERDIQAQALIQLTQLFLNPVYKKDPKKAADELLKSQKFDPKQFDYDDEEWEKMVQQIMQPQQSDPRLEVEKMRQQSQEADRQMKAQLEAAQQAFEAQQNDLDRQLETVFKQIDAENEQLREQGKASLTASQIQAKMREAIDKRKTELAINTQKIKSTERLVNMKASSDKLPKPPVEPPQKAKPGMSYQQ